MKDRDPKANVTLTQLSRHGKRATATQQMVFSIVTVFALLPLSAFRAFSAQQGSSNGATTKAQVFTGAEIQSQFANLAKQAKATGSGGFTLGNYGSHIMLLSLRTTSGGSEMHAHFDDVIFVRRGRATLHTGGRIVDGKTSADGETRGTSIQGGVEQTLVAGDVVHIPAGTPHQISIQPGTVFNALVVKVKE